MKKIEKYLALGLILMGAFTSAAYAEESAVRVRLDGENLKLSVPPIIRDGHTYLPLRDLFGLFGFEAQWDDSKKTAVGKMKDFAIEIPIGSKDSMVGGIKTSVYAPAFIDSGRTYVPLRFISETIGAEVLWDGNRRLITLTRNPLKKELDLDDPSLSAYLLQRAGKSADAELTVQDVRFITHLDVTGQGIYRLDGLEHMPWLQELKAGDNNITQLSPLKNLRWLKHLELPGNIVQTTHDLKALKNLEYLDLWDNKLDSLAGLENLYQLRTLKLAGNDLNPAEDFGPAYYLDQSLMTDVDRSLWEMPDYDTWNLRRSAAYSIPVAEGIYWVPASAAGAASRMNEDVGELFINSGSGKASQIKSVYDLLQFLENWSYLEKTDDKNISDTEKSLRWTYHRSPESVLQVGTGSMKALHVAAAYTLQTDYQKSGVLVMVDAMGNDTYVNYVYDGTSYFMYSPVAYLPKNRSASAIEDGNIDTYENSNTIRGNVHKTKDLIAFAHAYSEKAPALVYMVETIDRKEGQYPSGTYENNRGSGERYYFLPKDAVAEDDDDQEYYWSQRLELLYDDPNDPLRFRWAENSLEAPTWE